MRWLPWWLFSCPTPIHLDTTLSPTLLPCFHLTLITWNSALTPIISIAVVALIRELFRLFRGRPQSQSNANAELEQHYQRAKQKQKQKQKLRRWWRRPNGKLMNQSAERRRPRCKNKKHQRRQEAKQHQPEAYRWRRSWSSWSLSSTIYRLQIFLFANQESPNDECILPSGDREICIGQHASGLTKPYETRSCHYKDGRFRLDLAC